MHAEVQHVAALAERAQHALRHPCLTPAVLRAFEVVANNLRKKQTRNQKDETDKEAC